MTLGTLSNLAVIAASCTLVALGVARLTDRWQQSRAASEVGVEEVAEVRVDIGGAPSLGSTDAKVVVLEFSDFECPYCARYTADAFPRVREAFVDSGRVQYVFFHFPLAQHGLAIGAAVAANCAALQGHFWRMHELFFSNQAELTDERLRLHARSAGLDERAFDACLSDSSQLSSVHANVVVGRGAGVRSTPTLLVGYRESEGKVRVLRRIVGAQAYEVIENAVEDVLLEATE